MKPSLVLLIAASLIALPACEAERDDADEAPAQEPQEDPRQEVAMAAISELGSTLMGRVMEVVSSEGFEAAVHVCRDQAIPLTEEVAARHNVALGRTSDRLRNQDNTAPKWFDELAHKATEVPHFALGPDDELRGVAPIQLAPACTNCHGQKDLLADGVADALDAHYPHDQATGYEAGDLRGFFWVEVAAAY